MGLHGKGSKFGNFSYLSGSERKSHMSAGVGECPKTSFKRTVRNVRRLQRD
ncbi:hypothetical protein KIN20_028547 [Parelaphostrongylus tenuis]|uniref:Uncharacterized protein n=1 Tax=Parelaphostrongylus tenuis TaxID=148309 RepID=A0AAD5R139_PARTN|nr:hypothetical protein KIN20_028547 [Parelaphostrongylus tenuis]